MLAGLEAAHEIGIVHRDLKPANVFLARDHDGLFAVKLLDFGIAKVMEVAGGMGKKTKTGVLLGTPAYMSPEQIKSAKDVDGRADLWSAGVIFYEMLTGRTAFPAPTDYARLAAVLQTSPIPVDKVDPQLGALAPFMGRALQKDPTLRFQSAREMALALGVAATAAERHPFPGKPASRVLVSPLSRLPEHPWVGAEAAPEARVVEETERPFSLRLTPAPLAVPRALPPEIERGGDDTLASAGLSASARSSMSGALSSRAEFESRPTVEHGPFGSGTTEQGSIPKEARPVRKRAGLSPMAVVALMLLALVVGLTLGYALGRGLANRGHAQQGPRFAATDERRESAGCSPARTLASVET
jgi:serine/threonine-protein kinase